MRKFLIIVLILLAFGLSGCNNKDLSEPISNLEFWIAENVDDIDFSTHQMKYGMMGGEEYYGIGYLPTLDESGQQIDPVHCVLYTVTAYPDYSSKSKHITYIKITDPNIILYGLSLESSKEEIIYRLGELEGYSISESNGNITATKDKIKLFFSKDIIRISVEVTNKNGIIF